MLLLGGACSLTDPDLGRCDATATCVEAFGPEYVCGGAGFCEIAECEAEGHDHACSMPLVLADTCNAEALPVLTSVDAFRTVDTSALDDDFRALTSCLSNDTSGADGFARLDMVAGERWHFHLKTEGESNPALYLLPSCDERSCQPGAGADRCEDGSDEHMSFVPTVTGSYLLGIDAREAGGDAYELLAVRPVCGNGGMPEHSEPCDDGNGIAGDGCDDRCRAELRSTAPAEVEPNDDPTGANVALHEIGVPLTLRGRLGGRCDVDDYVVQVPEGASLDVQLSSSSGDCGNGTVPVELTLRSWDGRSPLGSGTPVSGNCPAIDDRHAFADDLAGGEYYLELTTSESNEPFDYAMAITVTMPAESGA